MAEKKEKTLGQSLQIIQQKLKAHKGQFNSFGKYQYRSCEDILEAVKPLLAETDTVLLLTDDVVLIGDWHYIKATVRLDGGRETVETIAFAREPEVKKGMDASQITGTASSYARKYALNGLFCIDDTKDSDATNKGENGTLAEPATYNKDEKTSPDSKAGKKKEAADLKAKIDELNKLAWFEFQTVRADDMPDGKVFKEEFFLNELREAFKSLSPLAKKKFVWNLTSVNKMAEQVKSENCLTDIKVAPDA